MKTDEEKVAIAAAMIRASGRAAPAGARTTEADDCAQERFADGMGDMTEVLALGFLRLVAATAAAAAALEKIAEHLEPDRVSIQGLDTTAR